MPIKHEAVEEVIEQVAAHMRSARPGCLEVEIARKIQPLGRHQSNTYSIDDGVIITIRIKENS